MKSWRSDSMRKKRFWLFGTVVIFCWLISVQHVWAESASRILSEAQSAYAMGDYKRSLQSIGDLFAFSEPDALQQAEAWKMAALDYFYLGKKRMARSAFQKLRSLSELFLFFR